MRSRINSNWRLSRWGREKDVERGGRCEIFKDSQISGIIIFMSDGVATYWVREVCKKSMLSTDERR